MTHLRHTSFLLAALLAAASCTIDAEPSEPLVSELRTPTNACGKTALTYNLVDSTVEELFGNGIGQPGPRRLVTEQESRVTAFGGRRFVQATPMDTPVIDVEFRKIAGSRVGGGTRFVICATDDTGARAVLDDFTVRGGRHNVGASIERRYSGLQGKRLSIRLIGRSPVGSARFLIDLVRPGGEGEVWRPTITGEEQAVPGFADLHIHQAADLAFSKGWYWGSHREGDESITLARCSGDNHATLQFLGNDVGIPLIDAHADRTGGHPEFRGWPAWDDIKHQQVALRWLKDAHERGLNVAVVSLVNNQWLSAATIFAGQADTGVSPADMESVKRQLLSLKELDAVTPWYRIVRDPWEARRAIANGELAVVLSVEVDDLMPPGDGPWRQQLHDLYDMGVRSLQLAHQANTHFAGAAYHRDVFQLTGRLKAWFDRDIDFAQAPDGVHNPVGLSDAGRELVDEMVRLNMLIDTSHLSLATQRDLFTHVATHHRHYPLYNSHTRVQELFPPEVFDLLKEHASTDETLRFIRRTGGIIGLRTGEEPMLDYRNHAGQVPVANSCDGSARSLAQFYQYADDSGVAVAFGSDFNGFITQMTPRFGAEACMGAAPEQRDEQIRLQGELPLSTTTELRELRERGLAHVGLLPALVDELTDLGVDTGNVEQSAEAFIAMWERAYDPARIPLP